MKLNQRENKVSIIIPSNKPLNQISRISYKHAIQQDYPYIELIIFLNGITKNEYKAVVSYLDKNNIYNHEIINYYSRKRISPGIARSKLINISKGNFIIFLDSDDIPNKQLISKKIKLAIKKNVDIICSSAYIFSNFEQYKNGFMKQRTYVVPLIILTLFLNSFVPLSVNLIPNSGTLIRKRKSNKYIFKNYPKNKHEDFIFYMNIIHHINSIALIEEPLIAYYINRKTLTGNKIISKLWHAKAISNITNNSLLKSILITIIGISLISPLIYLLEKMRILFKKNKKEISFILSRNN